MWVPTVRVRLNIPLNAKGMLYSIFSRSSSLIDPALLDTGTDSITLPKLEIHYVKRKPSLETC